MMGQAVAIVNKTASGAVKSGPGLLVGAVLAGGSDAATLILYDNTAGSGTILCKLAAAAGTTAVFCPAVPIVCGVGIYAALTGTAPSASVAYV
jgi:hypothetical protein